MKIISNTALIFPAVTDSLKSPQQKWMTTGWKFVSKITEMRFLPAKLDLLKQKLQHPTRTDIDLLRNTEQTKETSGSGIGLPNVLARLKFVCGDSATLTVDNLRAGGVVVKLEIEIIAEREKI